MVDLPVPDPLTLRQMVLNRVGLSSTDVDKLLRLFVDGVFNNAWRSGPIEDVHATQSGPSDGQMFRMNTWLIHRLRQVTAGWVVDHQVTDIDQVSLDQAEDLINRHCSLLLADPLFVTATQTIKDVAGRSADEIYDHIDQSFYGLQGVAEDMTPASAIYHRVLEGTMFRSAWGSPGWDETVDRFIKALDDPDDLHWRFGSRDTLASGLVGADRSRLMALLKDGPWDLSEDEARGVIRAGIGFVNGG